MKQKQNSRETRVKLKTLFEKSGFAFVLMLRDSGFYETKNKEKN